MATKTKKPAPPGANVVDAVAGELVRAMPELMPTITDGTTIGEFLRGLQPFFQKALQLELSAKSTLVAAKALVAPKTAEEDAAIQTFIRTASADTKAIETHWSITAAVFQFQRRLTGARKRGTDATEEAGKIAQELHNRYVADEARRVEAINAQRRREDELRAQADRDRELAALEQQALDAEAKSAELSERERTFVDLLFMGATGESAAKRSGYKNPFDTAARLMASPKIIAALEALRTAMALREQKAAVAQKPLDVQTTRVQADVRQVGVDRTTKTMEIFDARLFVEAVIGGRHGIPADMLMPDAVRGNQYARDLGELINRWPGVRLKKNTTTV